MIYFISTFFIIILFIFLCKKIVQKKIKKEIFSDSTSEDRQLYLFKRYNNLLSDDDYYHLEMRQVVVNKAENYGPSPDGSIKVDSYICGLRDDDNYDRMIVV